MSVQNKLARVVPTTSTPYIKGTEAPNYYLVVTDNEKAVVGFRPLNVAVPVIGSTPSSASTRVRVVPKDQSTEGLKRFACVVECVLGLEVRKYTNETQTHFSVVTSKAGVLIEKINTALSIL